MKGLEASGALFAPNWAATRGTIVAILYRLEGEPECPTASRTFTDVKEGDWYAAAVNWGAAKGVVKGYEDGTFRADATITREEMAAVLARYARYKGADVTARGDMKFYNDKTLISAWAREDVIWAVGVKLLRGTDNGLLEPQGTTTRAEAAQMLKNFCEQILPQSMGKN